MRGLSELAFAIARIILGIVILIEGLTVLAITLYINAMEGIHSDEIVAAYQDSYVSGYAQAYTIGYEESFGVAYEKGYDIGYEIGRGTESEDVTSTRIELRNLMYGGVREFLAQDTTDSNRFVTGEYVCADFAAQLNNNAENNGIRAAYVRIRAKHWGHALVAFNTVDRGIVFIEPQSDSEVKLVIGESYPWRSVSAVSPLGYNDPIEEIQIMW